MALTGAAGADIFFIPEIHFAGETPELDDEGWRYQVQVVMWCRECRKCRVRKEQERFQRNEWNKEQLAICARCVTGRDVKRASASMTRKVRKRIKNTPNPEASRRKYVVRMSPAHPRYGGRGADTCEGEVVYTIQEIRTLLRSQLQVT